MSGLSYFCSVPKHISYKISPKRVSAVVSVLVAAVRMSVVVSAVLSVAVASEAVVQAAPAQALARLLTLSLKMIPLQLLLQPRPAGLSHAA